jgi:hypothetical protein
MQDVLRNGVAAHKAAKDDLITKITANANNKFSAEFLATKGIEELQGLAALAHVEPVSNSAPPMFAGQSTPAAPIGNQGGDVEAPLTAPTLSFE